MSFVLLFTYQKGNRHYSRKGTLALLFPFLLAVYLLWVCLFLSSLYQLKTKDKGNISLLSLPSPFLLYSRGLEIDNPQRIGEGKENKEVKIER